MYDLIFNTDTEALKKIQDTELTGLRLFNEQTDELVPGKIYAYQWHKNNFWQYGKFLDDSHEFDPLNYLSSKEISSPGRWGNRLLLLNGTSATLPLTVGDTYQVKSFGRWSRWSRGRLIEHSYKFSPSRNTYDSVSVHADKIMVKPLWPQRDALQPFGRKPRGWRRLSSQNKPPVVQESQDALQPVGRKPRGLRWLSSQNKPPVVDTHSNSQTNPSQLSVVQGQVVQGQVVQGQVGPGPVVQGQVVQGQVGANPTQVYDLLGNQIQTPLSHTSVVPGHPPPIAEVVADPTQADCLIKTLTLDEMRHLRA
jgi:hypothetical protein